MNKTLLAVLMLGLSGSPAIAADPYRHTGIIDAIYPAENRIVINDQAYYTVPYVVVHGNGKSIGMEALTPSAAVGYNLERTNGNNITITEFWIMDSMPADESINDD